MGKKIQKLKRWGGKASVKTKKAHASLKKDYGDLKVQYGKARKQLETTSKKLQGFGEKVDRFNEAARESEKRMVRALEYMDEPFVAPKKRKNREEDEDWFW